MKHHAEGALCPYGPECSLRCIQKLQKLGKIFGRNENYV